METELINVTASNFSWNEREESEDANLFGFVTQGVLLSIISVLGFTGNVMSVYVLLKPSVKGIFSNLLTSLASFDGLFLLSAFFTFGLPTISPSYKKNVFLSIMPLTYGLSHTFRVGSVYSTLSVTLERFFAIVFPFKDFSTVKRWLLPSTAIFAILYNVPKFFELTTTFDPETKEVIIVGSSLRTDIYVSLYVFWSKFLLIELVPYVTIVILNSFILVKIIKSSRFRQRVLNNLRTEETNIELKPLNGQNSNDGSNHQVSSRFHNSMADEQMKFFEKQKQEHKLGGLLIAISVLFIVCQSFKIIPDLYEVLFCYNSSDCPSTPFVAKIIELSHLLVCINSAANVIIYLFGGEKFRKAWISTYCSNCFINEQPNEEFHGTSVMLSSHKRYSCYKNDSKRNFLVVNQQKTFCSRTENNHTSAEFLSDYR